MAHLIHPVILCGGNGTRLWPLSRARYPKQFSRILGPYSPFQDTALRLAAPGLAAPLIITGADFRFIVTEQLAAAGCAPGAVLIEPESKDTGPAILAAALSLARTEPAAILLVCPSDHVIGDRAAFQAAVQAGLPAAAAGRIVTFGVPPTHAETGYGYLKLARAVEMAASPQDLLGFVEKPDAATAAAMLADGRHLWNSGMFLLTAATLIAAAGMHVPGMLAAVQAAVANARADLGFLRLDPASWAEAPTLSIDYAIMEKSRDLCVVPLAACWSDLGSWEAIAREMWVDRYGVTTAGPAVALDCEDTLLRAESPDQTLVGIGLKNIIAVAMADAVLILDRSQSQRVKEAVTLLKARNAPQATDFPRFHRPWGWYETLAKGPRFQVKRITVHPGGILSLQSHLHRAEHWVVVQGTARVTVGAQEDLLSENQSVYVPLGAHHRLENPGKVDLALIEVQSGAYLDEDDITRYEDIYART